MRQSVSVYVRVCLCVYFRVVYFCVCLCVSVCLFVCGCIFVLGIFAVGVYVAKVSDGAQARISGPQDT